MKPKFKFDQEYLFKNRTSPIWDYNHHRRCRIYTGKQIGEERFKNRIFVFDIDLKEEDLDNKKVRLLLHADEIIEILRYA